MPKQVTISVQHYHAFISYSHSDCVGVSSAIQKAIETIGRPWYWIGKKNLDVFRDETDLSANPDLWDRIKSALQRAEFLILLASPKAAHSKWIAMEVEWWLKNKPANNLLIVVVKGAIQWDEHAKDFSWEKTDCLPTFLQQKFSNEPLFVDLRPYLVQGRQDIQDNIGFKSQVVKVISAIIKKPPREIFSDEVRRKNNIQKFLSAIGLILLGLIVILVFMYLDVDEKYKTIQNQLATNFSNNSKNALANNQTIFGLLYTAEAIISSKDELLTQRLLTDIEPFLPKTSLQAFLYTSYFPDLVFTSDGKKLLVASEGDLDWYDLANGTNERTERDFLDGKAMLTKVSPDAKYIFTTANYDNKAQIVEIETKKRIGPPLNEQKQFNINEAFFSPDGSLLAASCSDKTTRIWQVKNATMVGVPIQHYHTVDEIIFSPNSKSFVTKYSVADSLRHFNAITGQQIGVSITHDYYINSAVFSGDSKWILTTSFDNTARIWNAATGRQVGAPIIHSSNVISAVFSPNNREILTVSTDATISKWDVGGREQISRIPILGKSAWRGAFSPDTRMFLAYDSLNLQLWNTENGAPIGTPMYSETVTTSVDFSPDGKWIVAQGNNVSGQLWRVAMDEPAELSLASSTPVQSAIYGTQSDLICTVDRNNAFRIWNGTTGSPAGSLSAQETGTHTLVFSPDGKWVVTAGEKTVVRWDAIKARQVGSIITHMEKVKAIAFCPDGKRFATACTDNTIRLWDVATHKQIGVTMVQRVVTSKYSTDSAILNIVFDPTGKWILSHGIRHAFIWEVATQKLIDSISSNIQSAVFSVDGGRLLTLFTDRVEAWDMTIREKYNFKKELGPPITHNDTIVAAVFSPNGKKILTANRDGTARVWGINPSAESWLKAEQVGPSMQHKGKVTSAVYSPDGTRILTASVDSTAILWDAATGRPISLPMRHGAAVKTALFSPNGHKVLTVSEEGLVRIWKIMGDLDITPELFKLQTQALTGVQINLNNVADQIQPIRNIEWEALKKRYDMLARVHYVECNFKEYNLWRRFHPEEAAQLKNKAP